jgi:hypothetical protein
MRRETILLLNACEAVRAVIFADDGVMVGLAENLEYWPETLGPCPFEELQKKRL